jgi:hypothetical protein
MAVWECEGEDKAIWKGTSGGTDNGYGEDQEGCFGEENRGMVRKIVCGGEW